MKVRPLSLKQANVYVVQNHRHHNEVRGHKFSIGAFVGEELHGVAIVGRPVSRMLDDGSTLEVLRLCTDGYKNACSFLYSACARAARCLGYKKIVTYILETESGTSLKASGWVCKGECGGCSWDCPSRPRELEQTDLFGSTIKYPTLKKKRFEREL